MPRVLFIHNNHPDYLLAGLFHGLRSILGSDCVDIPRYDCMYAPLSPEMKKKCAGHGFTLYGLLEDIPELSVDRFLWHRNLDKFDLFILPFVAGYPLWGLNEILWDLVKSGYRDKIVLIDSHDTDQVFPWAMRFWRRPWFYLTPRKGIKTFKRELSKTGIRSIFVHNDILPIGFSIPESKITRVTISDKTKLFCRYVVDEEITKKYPELHLGKMRGGAQAHIFENEEDYYKDLQLSKYGVTTKRAGWDCLRHYEMAANGCVLSFRNLEQKPGKCSPLGLNSANSISYKNADDLERKISRITDSEYEGLLENSYHWIDNNTTKARALYLLNQVQP